MTRFFASPLFQSTDVYKRQVQHMNHRFVLRVVEDEFKSHEFGSAKELLLHDLPAERATVLYDVNEKQILERLKAIIEVKDCLLYTSRCV